MRVTAESATPTAEAWIEAHGLAEEDGEPRAPPDPDPEPAGDSGRSGGLLGRLGGGES